MSSQELDWETSDIRHLTSILQPSGIALYKNRRGASLHLSLPHRGRLTIREYPHPKWRRATHLNPSAPRIVIPSAVEGSLLHCRHMHAYALVQTTPWCFLFRLSLTHGLPLCKKGPSTSALMTRKKNGCLPSSFIPLRRVVPLRGTLSCAFGAALLQGPTRIIEVTGD